MRTFIYGVKSETVSVSKSSISCFPAFILCSLCDNKKMIKRLEKKKKVFKKFLQKSDFCPNNSNIGNSCLVDMQGGYLGTGQTWAPQPAPTFLTQTKFLKLRGLDVLIPFIHSFIHSPNTDWSQPSLRTSVPAPLPVGSRGCMWLWSTGKEAEHGWILMQTLPLPFLNRVLSPT